MKNSVELQVTLQVAEQLVDADALLLHGVSSVRSRVVNLSELNPKITSESIVPHLLSAFEEVYNGKASEVAFGEIISRP